MSRRMPTPLAQAFVVCRQIFEDTRTHEFILISPINELPLPTYPYRIQLSFYVHLSGGHGDYQLTLLLNDSAGHTPWKWELPGLLSLPDPLKMRQIALYDCVMTIAEPGRYELALLANGDQIAQQSIDFCAPASPG
jgi:hypothetical protein